MDKNLMVRRRNQNRLHFVVRNKKGYLLGFIQWFYMGNHRDRRLERRLATLREQVGFFIKEVPASFYIVNTTTAKAVVKKIVAGEYVNGVLSNQGYKLKFKT